jgi:hypothetical protein
MEYKLDMSMMFAMHDALRLLAAYREQWAPGYAALTIWPAGDPVSR